MICGVCGQSYSDLAYAGRPHCEETKDPEEVVVREVATRSASRSVQASLAVGRPEPLTVSVGSSMHDGDWLPPMLLIQPGGFGLTEAQWRRLVLPLAEKLFREYERRWPTFVRESGGLEYP